MHEDLPHVGKPAAGPDDATRLNQPLYVQVNLLPLDRILCPLPKLLSNLSSSL